MAEEFVSKDQFQEFTKRIEQGFDHVNQRFDHVNQRFDQVNQRFDLINQRLDDLRAEMRANNTNTQAEMRQMRNWLIGLYGIVVFGFIGSIFLTIIKQTVP